MAFEALHDLPLVLEQGEIRQYVLVISIVIRVEEGEVDEPGAEEAGGGLEEHGLIEAAPDDLRGLDEVLDAAGGAVGFCAVRVKVVRVRV